MALTIRPLHAGTMCPAAAPLLGRRFPRVMTCRCWLVETEAGLVLVETGFGRADLHDSKRLGPARFVLGIDHGRTRAIIDQLPELGYRASDVRHIVATHLDVDHAGGIPDFPHATVHCLRAEHVQATTRPSLADRSRYRPVHVDPHRNWALYDETSGEAWNGFDVVRQLDGLPPEILLVPLPGHSVGHACVAVETREGWSLHAGDAYFESAQLRDPGHASRGLNLFRRSVDDDHGLANRNLQRLRQLDRAGCGVHICCAHDVEECA